MKRLHGPIKWFGGKGKMVEKLVLLLPEHIDYVEPFFGGGALFFAKKPSRIETINDLNGNVMNFFRTLRDYPDEFIHLVTYTEYGRDVYLDCLATWNDESDSIKRAWKFWVVARMSFGGFFGSSFGTVVTNTRGGMAGTTRDFLFRISEIPLIVNRLQRVQIENTDALTVIKRYSTENTLTYCDPPYVHSERKSFRYSHEMTDDDHRNFVNLLLETPGKIIVSGYSNPIYDVFDENGWIRCDFQTACYSAPKTGDNLGDGSSLRLHPRIETVWLNPLCRSRII